MFKAKINTNSTASTTIALYTFSQNFVPCCLSCVFVCLYVCCTTYTNINCNNILFEKKVSLSTTVQTDSTDQDRISNISGEIYPYSTSMTHISVCNCTQNNHITHENVTNTVLLNGNKTSSCTRGNIIKIKTNNGVIIYRFRLTHICTWALMLFRSTDNRTFVQSMYTFG